jgi:hypothetical protein
MKLRLALLTAGLLLAALPAQASLVGLGSTALTGQGFGTTPDNLITLQTQGTAQRRLVAFFGVQRAFNLRET